MHFRTLKLKSNDLAKQLKIACLEHQGKAHSFFSNIKGWSLFLSGKVTRSKKWAQGGALAGMTSCEVTQAPDNCWLRLISAGRFGIELYYLDLPAFESSVLSSLSFSTVFSPLSYLSDELRAYVSGGIENISCWISLWICLPDMAGWKNTGTNFKWFLHQFSSAVDSDAFLVWQWVDSIKFVMPFRTRSTNWIQLFAVSNATCFPQNKNILNSFHLTSKKNWSLHFYYQLTYVYLYAKFLCIYLQCN